MDKEHFARGYYVSTVGLNKNTIKKYIREQETEDMIQDKRSVRNTKILLRVVRVTKAIGKSKATKW